jgi:hypothetical protein
MGLFSLLNDLLDEDDAKFEERVNKTLDKVEGVLGGAVNKAENGIKAADKVVTKLENTASTLDRQTEVITNKLKTD